MSPSFSRVGARFRSAVKLRLATEVEIHPNRAFGLSVRGSPSNIQDSYLLQRLWPSLDSDSLAASFGTLFIFHLHKSYQPTLPPTPKHSTSASRPHPSFTYKSTYDTEYILPHKLSPRHHGSAQCLHQLWREPTNPAELHATPDIATKNELAFKCL